MSRVENVVDCHYPVHCCRNAAISRSITIKCGIAGLIGTGFDAYSMEIVYGDMPVYCMDKKTRREFGREA